MGFLGNDVSNLRLFDFLMRLFVIPVSVATIWISVTTQQNNSIYGDLEFKNLTGLKYMVCITGVCAGYALFAALCSWFKWLVTKPWIFFVIDQVLAYLMVTSMTALGEFLYLAYNGDQVVSWSEACASYGDFCNKLRFALALHIIDVFCFLILAVISAYRTFRIFEPPFVSSKENEREMT